MKCVGSYCARSLSKVSEPDTSTTTGGGKNSFSCVAARRYTAQRRLQLINLSRDLQTKECLRERKTQQTRNIGGVALAWPTDCPSDRQNARSTLIFHQHILFFPPREAHRRKRTLEIMFNRAGREFLMHQHRERPEDYAGELMKYLLARCVAYLLIFK
jgi:hypothetical protein